MPMRLCLDVGHRNMEDPAKPESNPYEWIRRYGEITPVIHLQQSDSRASQHWPFTSEFNRKGCIEPDDLMAAIEQSGLKKCLLVMEINHKAYHPYEIQIIDNLSQSMEYWRSVVA